MGLIVFCLIFSVICALVAHYKGRNILAWLVLGFLFSWVSLLIVACLPSLKEQRAHRLRMESETRRLREQLRQEQIKSESYRQYTMRRLDAHDGALNMDTRTAPALAGGEQGVPLLGAQMSAPADAWYYESQGNSVGPVTEDVIRALIVSGTLKSNSLVWREGFAEWTPISQLGTFSDLTGT